jgi:hypothetical protein
MNAAVEPVRSRRPKLLEAGHPDNFQTPASALDCLLPHLQRDWTIWEPACGKGNLANGLRAHGFDVRETDINRDEDEDFLRLNPSFHWDAIITNPPFSIKEKFLARCYQLGKPFALLMPITTFDSAKRRSLFHRHGVQVILPNGRVNFETPNGAGSSSWFYTAFFTNGLNLPAQLNFHGVEAGLV